MDAITPQHVSSPRPRPSPPDQHIRDATTPSTNNSGRWRRCPDRRDTWIENGTTDHTAAERVRDVADQRQIRPSVHRWCRECDWRDRPRRSLPLRFRKKFHGRRLLHSDLTGHVVGRPYSIKNGELLRYLGVVIRQRLGLQQNFSSFGGRIAAPCDHRLSEHHVQFKRFPFAL